MRNTTAQGFSLVELIVIISVSAIFFLSAIQLSLSITQVAEDGNQRTIASNHAYMNLRKFANGAKPLFYDCETYDGANQLLLNATERVEPIPGLPGTISQQVTASAPYGCGDAASGSLGMPIRVQSQVTYGPANNRKTITHATYATY